MSGWTKKEIVERLREPEPASLFAEAAAVRLAVHGRCVHLRALLEIGNICRANCLYCGLRRCNASLERYSLDADTIVETAFRAVKGGFRTVVMQAGEDGGKRPDFMRDIVASIRNFTDAAITLSFGEWPEDAYGMWRQAGADRYLLRFETSNRQLYSRLRPGRTLGQRLSCLEFLRKSGYQVGTGFMVGLPGQTVDDLAQDLLLLHALDPAMAGIGPYIPHPRTPLAGKYGFRKGPDWREDPVLKDCEAADMSLRCLAMARIMNPFLHLPATTALEVALDNGYGRGLSAGANVLMVDVTPSRYNRAYDIYPGREPGKDEDPAELWKRCSSALSALGYAVSDSRGDGKKAAPSLVPESAGTGNYPCSCSIADCG
ncbi:MAG: [FeFe] hydrogenase H-cluster radical SAM maturase HydE [Acidobacteria bacterium]|nr:[FeFe] hydrogenase H-cluster radical SAM maturase HydE [Acidobacteriota bacterium]